MQLHDDPLVTAAVRRGPVPARHRRNSRLYVVGPLLAALGVSHPAAYAVTEQPDLRDVEGVDGQLRRLRQAPHDVTRTIRTVMPP